MRNHEKRQSTLLEKYLNMLSVDPDAPPPDGLDPRDARVARLLAREMSRTRPDASSPAPEFVALLRQRLEREAEMPDPKFVASLRRRLEHEADLLRITGANDNATVDDHSSHSSGTERPRLREPLWLYPVAALLLTLIISILFLPIFKPEPDLSGRTPPGATLREEHRPEPAPDTTEREQRQASESGMSKTTKTEATTQRQSNQDFPTLRPSWLPQPMQIREEHRVDRRGVPFVELSFHRPEDTPATPVLTLVEQRAGAGTGVATPAPQESTERVGGALGDPRRMTEQIGGREVVVGYRFDACIWMYWEQDGISLNLTNTYDPPGQPLYSCAEMRRIVESMGR